MGELLSQQVTEAINYLHGTVPSTLNGPIIGIICGSGLDGLANTVLPDSRYEIPYGDIPHFPRSTGDKMRSSKHHAKLDADRS